MKILVLNYEYPPIGGGAGVQTQLINECLTRKDHEIILITSHFKGLPFIEITNNYFQYRVPVFRNRAERSRFIEMLLYLLMAFPLAVYLFYKEKPEVIHAHFILPCGILAVILKAIFKVRVVVTAHGGDVPSHQPDQTKGLFRFFKPIAQYVVNQADQIHAVSKGIERKIKNDFKINDEKITMIPNSIKVKNVVFQKEAPVKFLFLGRISPEKNLEFILDCFEEIKEDYRFYIVGSGKTKNLIDQVSRSKLKDKVIFTGWLDKAGVEEYLKKCHYLILHSSAEGLSMAGLEANMYGLPIIGSDIEGIRDYVIDGLNGFLCPLKNKTRFVDLLNKVCSITNEYDKMSKSSKMLCLKHYNINNNIKLIISLLNGH